MNALEDFRRRKDERFRTPGETPFDPDQVPDFEGLAYFPEDPSLVFDTEVLPVDPEEIRLATSGERGDPRYRKFGRVRLEVERREVTLTLFRADDEDALFVPFRDSTTGIETYGAGRYLRPALPDGGRVVIDFNYAYNPWCAYTDRWSCALPPSENWLEVPIRAGERIYPRAVHGRARPSTA